MDSQTLVNILVEIAELEELRLNAEGLMQVEARQAEKLSSLSAEYRDDARTVADEVQKGARNLRAIDGEIKDVSARLADREDRLIGVSDRRQHHALQTEITGLKNRLEQLDNEAMALLEQEESGLAAADQAEAESRLREQAAAEARRHTEDSARDLSTRLHHIDQELARLLGMLPPTEQRHVTRLKKKLDQSVVHLHNGACQGCFHQLPVQEALNVERGRTLVRCPSCLRYVVHRSWK